MRILLVEDDDTKRTRIMAAIASYRQVAFAEARSLRSAQDALDASPFDLVILDMSMPTFDVGTEELGGRFQATGGTELLRYMKRYAIHTPVVVVTQFSAFGHGKDALTLAQLNEKLSLEHGEGYLGAIYYDTASEDWKEKLATVVDSQWSESLP